MPGLLLRRSTSNSRPSFSSPSASPSASPSPSPSPPPTLHHRRIISRSNTSSPPPPQVLGLGLPTSLFPRSKPLITSQSKSISGRERHARSQAEERLDGDEIEVLGREESDVECWLRMLALQREFHCYNSARLEAAVEALERGCSIEEVTIPSRLCLDLLNEGLMAQMAQFRGQRV